MNSNDERLALLRVEAETNLDRSMFTPHPDGYLCRCGIVESCVCPSTWPELVAAEQGALIRELRTQLAAARKAQLQQHIT